MTPGLSVYQGTYEWAGLGYDWVMKNALVPSFTIDPNWFSNEFSN